jgi:heme exporter protein A
MLQRLALARATMHHPGLLLLDEPYSALDAAALQQLDRFLREYVAGGGTMVVVTHQIQRGLAACERAVALKAGRIVYDGRSRDFLSSPEAGTVGDWD